MPQRLHFLIEPANFAAENSKMPLFVAGRGVIKDSSEVVNKFLQVFTLPLARTQWQPPRCERRMGLYEGPTDNTQRKTTMKTYKTT